MTTSDKERELVSRLLAKTDAGAVRWREGVDGVTFVTDVGPYQVSVAEVYDDKSAWPPYVLDVATQEGNILESFYSRAGSETRKTFESLYRAARGSARGADDVMDELLNTLQAA